MLVLQSLTPCLKHGSDVLETLYGHELGRPRIENKGLATEKVQMSWPAFGPLDDRLADTEHSKELHNHVHSLEDNGSSD